MRLRFAACAVLAASLAAPGASAQQYQGPYSAEAPAVLASWVALDVATGYELRETPRLARQMPGWNADQWGNLVRVIGSGEPHRLLACSLDTYSLAVTQITEDGYLRVHTIGAGSRRPLWNQGFEANQVRVLTKNGPIAGVGARANGHFGYQHRNENSVITADDLWIDVGAESAEEVAEMGIELLDPIVRHVPAWPINGGVAGPTAGARVGCAVLAAIAEAAEDGEPEGTVHLVMGAQANMNFVGLSSYVARSPVEFDEMIVVDEGRDPREIVEMSWEDFGRAGEVFNARGVGSLTLISPETQAWGSHMERVTVREAYEVYWRLAGPAGIEIGREVPWVTAPQRQRFRLDHVDTSLDLVSAHLEWLAEEYSVSGHEWAVRRTLLENMPDWARERAQVDDMGNVTVEMGEGDAPIVFMAHLDEVGYEVTAIAEDGVVSLRRRGGSLNSAWEGQTALAHLDPIGMPSAATGDGSVVDERFKTASLRAEAPDPIRGVFLTRDQASTRHPDDVQAWFGMDGVELRAMGVDVGSAVTNYKEALRIGKYRFASRALDDRAGSAALLMALHDLDPDQVPGRVVFAWSVDEETGLLGAAALARRYGPTAKRIYSVDTFVSSDTPLESPHFAYTPLGHGPVMRAIENSSISPDAERDWTRAVAEAADIPLQTGLTQGGTDGTTFTFWGAPNQGLSWPGRYSHSPGEVLDLRDLSNLTRLIVALTNTPN